MVVVAVILKHPRRVFVRAIGPASCQSGIVISIIDALRVVAEISKGIVFEPDGWSDCPPRVCVEFKDLDVVNVPAHCGPPKG